MPSDVRYPVHRAAPVARSPDTILAANLERSGGGSAIHRTARHTAHTPDALRSNLHRIDGKGYKAYKDIEGSYRFDRFLLHVDHVQGDPFAAPSKVRVTVPAGVAGLPEWTLASRPRRIALCDFLTRAFDRAVRGSRGGARGSGKSGLVSIDDPGQEVLERTSVVLGADGEGGSVEARFVVGLPARGRRVLGRQAAELLTGEVPGAVDRALRFSSLDADALRRHLEVVEDQHALRGALAERNLIAFVGDGSVLPRRSGVDPRPLTGDNVVRFESPDALAVEIELPNRDHPVRGMGVSEGVTLIVGGGYHGKSTLLDAIELGIYDHVPGDGRELVAARPDAVKIRAEDGRRIERVDISPFIENLPFGTDTSRFSSDDASGSTSQAANISEALEAGAGALLMDEDTSATNFMIRDHRMQALVAKEKEPITPYIDKVRQLHRERGVSSVIVVGGAGDYFDVADAVVLMDEYRPREVTEEARAIAERFRELRRPEGGEAFGDLRTRRPDPRSIDPSRGKRAVKIDVKALQVIGFGTETIQLDALEQLVEISQTRAVGRALLLLRERFLDGGTPLDTALGRLEEALEADGLDLLAPFPGEPDGGFARPRRFEIAAALNRLRSLRVS